MSVDVGILCVKAAMLSVAMKERTCPVCLLTMNSKWLSYHFNFFVFSTWGIFFPLTSVVHCPAS